MPILTREEEILNTYLLTSELVTFILCEFGIVRSSMTYTLTTVEETGQYIIIRRENWTQFSGS